MTELIVELDQADLRSLNVKLAPGWMQAFLREAITDVAHVAEATIKEGTPVKTGNLRRSFQTNAQNAARFPNAEVRIESRASYANWIETGKDGRRTMRSHPDGYRMVANAVVKTEGDLEGILDNAARKVEARWAK